jgi:FixJ family two-component response regulator
VAIVDDDEHISKALGQWFEFRGLHYVCYSSGESLLQTVHNFDGKCTLPVSDGIEVTSRLAGAVLDLNLPGISGIELAFALRVLCPSLPLVIITALREEERLRFGGLPPDVHCLKKPFELDALEDFILPLIQDATRGKLHK